MIRLFRHYIPKSLLMFAALEFVVLLSAIMLSVSFRFYNSETPSELTLLQATIFCSVMLGTLLAMGLYQREVQDKKLDMIVRIIFSFAMGMALMSLLFYISPDLFLNQGVMFTAISSGAVGVILARLFLFSYVDSTFSQKRALIIGTGKRASRIERMRKLTDLRSFEVVGYWPVAGETQVIDSHYVLDTHRIKLFEVVAKKEVNEIVVAVDDRRKSLPIDALLDCKMNGVEVIDILTFLEQQTGKIDLDEINPSCLVFVDGYVHTVLKPVSKRIFDVFVSLSTLLLSLPIMLTIALAIWIESGCRGSVFYSQTRVGAGGREFSIYKFRSMIENAELEGAQYAEQNDPRITTIGHFIRKTRIDELPQLLNVLRGEMSFVGPRPERPEFVKTLKNKIPYYNLRHSLKPGITGWAQVKYPYGDNDEDSAQKLQFDLYYMKNYSLFLDLTILFQTVGVVLLQKGSR
ncbi:MAG: TIGR03013 family PEP-CTERM/XrtA system glycosyltransferase [Gammaproteobacteria bacterium]|nr:TIGR03013 family PEP-CTERM/XrtA system glycosyltransferase [Gammaproteobacteria bacterium]